MGQIKHNSYRFILPFLGVAILVLAALPLCAQTPSNAPIPAQLTTAKTVFVANAGSRNDQLALVAYDNLYQALVSGNRYHLATTPAEADLVLEVSVIQTDALTGYTKLVIRDAKSQTLLWTTYNGIAAAGREKTFEKNIANSAVQLVTNLNSLVTSTPINVPAAKVSAPNKPTPNASTPKKTRLSDKQ